MENTYTAIIIQEDDAYYARVPDLPGCFTTGRTFEETIELITDAANLWIIVTEDRNDIILPPSFPKDISDSPDIAYVQITVDTDTYRVMYP